MPEHLDVESAIDSLKRLGRPAPDGHWADGHPDYVVEYSLTEEHIPPLIETATTWTDADSEDPAVYAQIHAWRALAQLGAVEAVQPLLDVQEELDDSDDDWYLEDFHLVFGLIGPPATEQLAAFLRDTTRGRFPREKAAGGLTEIARRFPETRVQVIALLTEVLDWHDQTGVERGEFNGAVVSNLLDLNAVEAAEAIERAFAADAVDPFIAGDWGDVRQVLGVTGLGLAPDRTPGWPTLRERFGIPEDFGRLRSLDPKTTAANEERQRVQKQRKLKESKRRARAKRKEQKKSRKRNQKPR